MSKIAGAASEIDRLIDLASDDRNASREAGSETSHIRPERSALPVEDRKGQRSSFLRSVGQLRILLPHVARLLPLVERTVLGTNVLGSLSATAPPVDTSHFDRAVVEIEGANRNLSLVVKSQAEEIRYLQEQITWLGKSFEKAAGRQEEIAESLDSLKKWATAGGIVLAVLLAGLIAAVVFLVRQHS